MSELKKSTSSETSYKTSGNLFTQLRHLAGQVENGIQNLQQELDSQRSTSKGDSKHTSAINFLLHTKKDITKLRDEAREKMAEFSKGNDKVNRIQELMKSLLDLQSERLENVESYLEKYGYQRPNFAMNAKNDVVESDSGSESFENKIDMSNNSAYDESEIEENGNKISYSLNDCDEDHSPKTPPSHTAFEKPAISNIMRTPRVEDLYKNLSEETILLIKHGAKGKSQDEYSAKQNATMKGSTSSLNASINHTAASLGDRNVINKEAIESFSHNENNNGKFEYSSLKSHKTDVQGTPEMPKLLTSGFELNSVSKRVNVSESAAVARTDSSSTSKDRIKPLPRTPEPPALLLTELLTLNNQTGKYETSKSNVGATTPDTPKLLTPGFKLNSFFTKEAESTFISNIETPISSVSTVREVSKMKTPEAPTLLMPSLKQSIFDVNPPVKEVGKSARALFNTPPMPELKSGFLMRNRVVSGNNENMLISKTTTQETPKLFSQDNDINFHYKYATNSQKK